MIIGPATAYSAHAGEGCPITVAIEQAVKKNWKKFYKPRKCGLNTFNMAKHLVDNSIVDIKDIKILFISEAVVPKVFRKEHDGGDWGWHVLISWRDYVIDMDWNGKQKVMPVPLFETVVIYPAPSTRERSMTETKLRLVDTKYFFDHYHETDDDNPLPPGKFQESHFINDAPDAVAETIRLDQFVKRHFKPEFLSRPDFNHIDIFREFRWLRELP